MKIFAERQKSTIVKISGNKTLKIGEDMEESQWNLSKY